jgi:D-alanyl-D-alanine carboxypeptidase (penicillin-binding protein 5/6)
MTKRKFFSLEVPLWGAVVALIVLTILLTAGFYYTHRGQYFIPSAHNKTANLSYGVLPALSEPNYFTEVKNSFIEQKASFVEADLSSMKVTVYKKGEPTLEFPIVTKGKEGSWWETPAGIYKIETKEVNHFSSIGHVYQPWSMQFQGNFFIHGWPFYQDGTEVSSTFSGGCIRMKTDDAKKLYDAVTVGMPILVYEKDFGTDGFNYSIKPPGVTAKQYLVADLKSNNVILSKDPHTRAPIASVTKLVTALVAAEYINLDKTITITNNMIASTSKPRLSPGQEVSVYNLMFPLLMESSNEAAKAISQQLGTSRFVELMNQKTKSFGMTATTFADPAGSLAENVSTPDDLFALAKYLNNNRSFILKMSAGNVTTSGYGEPIYTNLQNFNLISGANQTFIGGKTGKSTAAGETYMGVFEMEIQGEKRPIAIIILGSDDIYKDTKTMLDYLESLYH